jgi:hypothetical protein
MSAGPVRIVRMGGSSIAAPAAAGWMTDFLNAAYFARPADERTVDDLRLAMCILTTRWASRGGRRLGARDLPAFHRAFGASRMRSGGRADREALLAGAARMFGDWFPAAYADDRRRAHGIAFPTVEDRQAFDPSLRLRHGALGPPAPPQVPPEQRHWSTYPPVALPDLDAALRFLADPARWPDMASVGGRFTAVRGDALRGTTFEIDVSVALVPRAPIFSRAYVSCTADRRGPSLDEGLAVLADHCAEALPDGAEPVALIELTSHRGHFLGRARSHLLVFTRGGQGYIRDVGCWDRLPPHLAAAYAGAGREAQAAFWGPEPEETSMLTQLARVTSTAG